MKDYVMDTISNSYDIYGLFREEIKKYGLVKFLDIYTFDNVYSALERINRLYFLYRYFVCILEVDSNFYVSNYLKDEKVVNSFFNESRDNSFNLYNLSLDNLTYLFEYAIKHGLVNDLSHIIGSQDYSKLETFISGDCEELIVKILKNHNEAYKKFVLNDGRALDYIKRGLIPIKPVKMNKQIIESDVLFNKLKDSSIVEMRVKFDEMMCINPSIVLEEKMNKYEDNIINNFDLENDCLKYYDDLSDFKNRINDDYYIYSFRVTTMGVRKTSELILKEVTMDRLFKDNYYNVILNIKELLRYYHNSNNNIIDNDHFSFYNKIVCYDALTNQEKIDFYNSYKNSNINTMFYEDLKKCRLELFNNINNNLFQCRSNTRNELYSNLYETDVYCLNGESFNMIIRGLSTPYREKSYNNYRDCYSIITNNNTSRVDTSYYYGYLNISVESVLSSYEKDAYSSDVKNNTKMINRLMEPDEIALYSGLSELQLHITDGKALKPSYLVCFNLINDKNIKEAKRLGIPIVLINEKNYNKIDYIKKDIASFQDKYIDNAHDELKKMGIM